jgi:hypothetical protein
MIERLAMFRGIEQKARVRRDVERRFCEAEKFLVHAEYGAGEVPGAEINKSVAKACSVLRFASSKWAHSRVA